MRMAIESGQTSKLDGLTTALDTVVSPKEAFQRIRAHPTWGWALLVTIVVYALASYLMGPALVHATQADWPNVLAKTPSLAVETPQQQQMHLALVLKIVGFSWLITPIIVIFGTFLQTIIMVVFNMAARGSGSFRQLWSAAVNIAVPAIAINGAVTAIIVLVRGSQSFDSAASLQLVIPSLGYLVPETSLKLHAFLSMFNPFTLWGCGLVIAAMAITAGVSRTWAWITGISWLLINGAVVALLAR
jgi:hypothetical protein